MRDDGRTRGGGGADCRPRDHHKERRTKLEGHCECEHMEYIVAPAEIRSLVADPDTRFWQSDMPEWGMRLIAGYCPNCGPRLNEDGSATPVPVEHRIKEASPSEETPGL